jgi:hypothetical protein
VTRMAGPSNEPTGGPAADEPGDPSVVEVVRLDDAAVKKSVGNATEKAKAWGIHIDNFSRGALVVVMCILFIWLNRSVVNFVQVVFAEDVKHLSKLAAGATPSRVVTTEVLMTLIGSTAVQVGAAILTIVAYLFPKNRGGNGE